MKRGWPVVLALTICLALPTSAAAEKRITALAPIEVFADGFRDPRGIAVDASGNVYVTDRQTGTVTRVAPNRTRTVVASGLQGPLGLAFDSTGHLLIAEQKAGRVLRIESDGSRTVIISKV